ncbi:MAG: chorismate mutase [Chloroflexi bacterium]|nr:chorismate mutase [Chloroflexota bacterium]
MHCRGIRGATTVAQNTREAIITSTKELLQRMIDSNGIEPDNVAGAIFTTTTDLNAEFPATAAREMGWNDVAMLCSHEINVPGSLPMCLRIMVFLNTEKSAKGIVHTYTKGAKNLKTRQRE